MWLCLQCDICAGQDSKKVKCFRYTLCINGMYYVCRSGHCSIKGSAVVCVLIAGPSVSRCQRQPPLDHRNALGIRKPLENLSDTSIIRQDHRNALKIRKHRLSSGGFSTPLDLYKPRPQTTAVNLAKENLRATSRKSLRGVSKP